MGNGNEEFVTEKECNIFKTELKDNLKEIKDNIKTLFNRLNWFYLIAISTLVGALSNVVMVYLTLKK